MSVTAIVGAQWGDEGKGRVVDFLAQQADMVVRYQGGDNAGHTVVNAQGTFRLHLIPSGIFNPEAVCLLGTGMAINPARLLEEMAALRAGGVDLSRLVVSGGAQMLMPYHIQLDQAEERARAGAAIGTTGRGIGPAYADKAARNGLRIGDLNHLDYIRARLELVLPRMNRSLMQLGTAPFDPDALLATCAGWAQALSPLIIDPVPLLREAVQADREILLEGQLGVMRDLDWGIYPYVTSSNPIAGGATTGAGLPPSAIRRVIGVVKAYSTCVGAGPFPTELQDETGQYLREVGGEFGATTGRPRRCGWLDSIALRRAAWLNGLTGLAITKLDVLDGLAEIKICTGYQVNGTATTELPHTALLARAQPIYETWPGWQADTTGVRRWQDLPAAAQAYLSRIAELTGTLIDYVSVGPEREAMIVVR